MGPLEVVPGSHEEQRPPGAGGPADASASVVALPILVGPGDVTLYWSSLQHRGGANTGSTPRPTFHIAAIGDGGAPTGMPYTVLVDDLLATYGEADDHHAPRAMPSA